MPRQRWTVELSPEAAARLARAGAGGPLRVGTVAGPVEARLLSAEAIVADLLGAPGAPVGEARVRGGAEGPEALEGCAPLRAVGEEGLQRDDPRLRALAARTAQWWEELPAACAEADLLRAGLLWAALDPEEAERALRPWRERPAPGLLLAARLSALRAACLAELGRPGPAQAEAEAALSALERRPRRCAAGELLRENIVLLIIQLALERAEPLALVHGRLGQLAGPAAGWDELPLRPGEAAVAAELGALRAALAAPAEHAALRERWLRRQARWADRGPAPLGRRVALLRGLLCAEAGMPLEARAWWAAAAAPGGGPRARLLARAASRLHEAGGPADRSELRALGARSAFAAAALDGLERAAALGPGRARFDALPLSLR